MDLGDSPWLLWLALALAAGTAEVLSLSLNLLRTLWVFAGRVLEADHIGISRGQKLERREVPIINRHVLYFLGSESH